MLIVLCGPPLVGKATIARFLSQKHNFQVAHIGSSNHGHDHDHGDFGDQPTFPSVSLLESFIMSSHRWRQDWVVLGVHDPNDIALLRKRPFVLVVAVDAPILTRFERSNRPPLELHAFLVAATHTKNPCSSPHYALLTRADLAIVNDSSSLPQLEAALNACDLLNPQRLRPGWDAYFMSLCHLAAQRSNCMKRRVGCLVVSPAHRVLSTGYNGTPRGLPNCANGGCSRCNDATAGAGVSLDACLCMHAEENALLEIGRGAEGATLYCTTFPCLGCAKKIVQCGIRHVIYGHGYNATSDSRVVDQLFGRVGIAFQRVAPKLSPSMDGVQVVVVSSH